MEVVLQVVILEVGPPAFDEALGLSKWVYKHYYMSPGSLNLVKEALGDLRFQGIG